jgi:formylglycine-generating enzyme required for sulfatase activity
MKTHPWTLPALSLIAVAGQALAQTQAELSIRTHAALHITGTVGRIYAIEYVADLAQTNDARAWRSLDFLQLPASPYVWTDASTPLNGNRFYRAVYYPAPPGMAYIPPGRFRMGSSKAELGRSTIEGPQSVVTISRGFWMGKFEVTQGEYQAVVGHNPSTYFGKRPWTDVGEDLSRPVETVSWDDAVAYCATLTARELAAGRITANSRYRLPTEAEWEYACRAWTATRFSFGDDPSYVQLELYAWHEGNNGWVTHSVGQKLPNPWGLYDMHGNVSEWCLDRVGIYSDPLGIDPKGPAIGTDRISRGAYTGSPWDYGGGMGGPDCRSAARNSHDPSWKDGAVGFRVVLAPE